MILKPMRKTTPKRDSSARNHHLLSGQVERLNRTFSGIRQPHSRHILNCCMNCGHCSHTANLERGDPGVSVNEVI